MPIRIAHELSFAWRRTVTEAAEVFDASYEADVVQKMDRRIYSAYDATDYWRRGYNVTDMTPHAQQVEEKFLVVIEQMISCQYFLYVI